MTLIEVLVVVFISVLLIISLVRFFISTQRTAHHGLDRLESLTVSRIALESVARDLKLLCFNDRIGFSAQTTGPTRRWVFPLFAGRPPDNRGVNPVNKVVYEYDSRAKTLKRTLLVNQLLRGRQEGFDRVIAGNVEDFQIIRRDLFSYPSYVVEIKCQTPHPQRKKTAVHLRTEVRSEFEMRLYRHRYQISNYFSPPLIDN